MNDSLDGQKSRLQSHPDLITSGKLLIKEFYFPHYEVGRNPSLGFVFLVFLLFFSSVQESWVYIILLMNKHNVYQANARKLASQTNHVTPVCLRLLTGSLGMTLKELYQGGKNWLIVGNAEVKAGPWGTCTFVFSFCLQKAGHTTYMFRCLQCLRINIPCECSGRNKPHGSLCETCLFVSEGVGEKSHDLKFPMKSLEI